MVKFSLVDYLDSVYLLGKCTMFIFGLFQFQLIILYLKKWFLILDLLFREWIIIFKKKIDEDH